MQYADAEQSFNGNYTVLFAPPELLKLHGTSNAAPPGAAHDIWALGVLFQQLLTATRQSNCNPWFVPDALPLAAIQDEAEKMDALYCAVEIWVCSAHCHDKLLSDQPCWLAKECQILSL